MKSRHLIPKHSWAEGLLAAAMFFGLQAGAGLPPGGAGMAAGAEGAPAAAKASASGSGAGTQVRAEQPAPPAAEPARSFAGKRDPFKLPPPPREAKGEDSGAPMLPGKRGLVIGQLRLLGIVRQVADQSMIAVVTNQTNRAYFLRVHDEVYNGVVSGITADSLRFRENRLERGGRLEIREIVLKLGSPLEEGR